MKGQQINLKILVTGAQGFIAKNLLVRLKEKGYSNIVTFDKDNTLDDMKNILSDVDFIFHLAGVNRPKNDNDFLYGNKELTRSIISLLKLHGRKVPILLSSSIQANLDNPYGRSKLAAEQLVQEYMDDTGAPVFIYRLPNVFGKWCRPNYNSAVATFCYNIANNLPINVNDANAPLSLAYIDDVCSVFIEQLKEKTGGGYKSIEPIYSSTVGSVVSHLYGFKKSRSSLIVDEVGTGFVRALYSTYLSYLDTPKFSYVIPNYSDERGTFVEMLKTPSAGQISFFTAYPGITRGGHYHHSKNEKFLVIKGKANFRFKHIVSQEFFELNTEAGEYRIVETIPGWAHDITNIGQDELIVMLWANENFDREKPDTIESSVV